MFCPNMINVWLIVIVVSFNLLPIWITFAADLHAKRVEQEELEEKGEDNHVNSLPHVDPFYGDIGKQSELLLEMRQREKSRFYGGSSSGGGGQTFSLPAGQEFSCTKRALSLYKVIVNSIYRKLQDLLPEKSSNDYATVIFKLGTSIAEIKQLNLHLRKLENVLNLDPVKVSRNSKSNDVNTNHVDAIDAKVSKQAIQFCRNLDEIEDSIISLIARIRLDDSNRKSYRMLNSGWSSLFLRLSTFFRKLTSISNLTKFAITSILIIMLGMIYQVPTRRRPILVIIFILLTISLYQAYHKLKKDHINAHERRYRVQLQSSQDCSFAQKLFSWSQMSGFTCSDHQWRQYQQLEAIDSEQEFDENFNILHFLSHFTIDVLMSQVKQIGVGISQIFDHMVIGDDDDDSWGWSRFIRRILFGNILKPIFALLFIYVAFKYTAANFIFANSLRWFFDRVDFEEQQSQSQSQSQSQAQAQLQSTADHQRTAASYYVTNMTVNYHGIGAQELLPRSPPPPDQIMTNIKNNNNNIANNLLLDVDTDVITTTITDDVYLSAEDDDDDGDN